MQRGVERRGWSAKHDSGANADLFIMLGKRFGDPPGRRLHINFPRAGKCADRSNVSEDSVHFEFQRGFTQETVKIAIANPPSAGKTTGHFPLQTAKIGAARSPTISPRRQPTRTTARKRPPKQRKPFP